MTAPIYKSKAWRAVRKKILERDGHVCQIRLPRCTGVATAVDHIVDWRDGGEPFAEENLQAACTSCNTSKKNRLSAARARAFREVREW